MSIFNVRVTISRRAAVFDPEARVITQGLERLGHAEALRNLAMHRVFMLTLEVPSAARAREVAAQMCEQVLHEPALEEFSIEVLPL